MPRYVGLYQRKSGYIEIFPQEITFTLEGDSAAIKSIRYSQLRIKNVGVNSPIYALSDLSTPEDVFTTSDASVVLLLQSRGVRNAADLVVNTNNKQRKKIQFIGGVVAVFFFVAFVIPYLISQLPLSVLDKFISYKQERALLGTFYTSTKEDSLNNFPSKNLNKLYLFLQDKNPDLKDIDVDISVTNEKVSNAFTLPAGQIVFTKELISEAESIEEVLGVLGHELGHVKKRHILRQTIKGLGFYSGLVIVQVFFGTDVARLASFGISMNSLSFSRENEEEADAFSYEALKNAGISSRGMLRFFERLSAKESGVDSLFSVLRTHPLSKLRKEKLGILIQSSSDNSLNANIPVTLNDLKTEINHF